MGGRGQEDGSLRPVQAILEKIYLKNKIEMKGLGTWLKWQHV
jgi:hypothetical protein